MEIFLYYSKLTQFGCDEWAGTEWKCCKKSPEQGAKQGATFIQTLIIEATEEKFDDFAITPTDNNKPEGF